MPVRELESYAERQASQLASGLPIIQEDTSINSIRDEMPSSSQLPDILVCPDYIEHGPKKAQTCCSPRDIANQSSAGLTCHTTRLVSSGIHLCCNFDASGCELARTYEEGAKAMEEERNMKTQAAEAERSVLLKRIEELESSKTTMEGDLEYKEVMLRRAIATSQRLQQSHDKLKELYECMAKESEEKNHSALNRQIAATLVAVEERNNLQQQLNDALNANRILATSLAAAQNQATFFERRTKDLSYAVAQTPNEVANTRGIIELKDKMFADANERARECSAALKALEAKSLKDRDIVRKEIALLKAKAEKDQRTIAELRTSRESFQRHTEAILAMLRTKFSRDDLINAMEGYFQTVIQDNSVLKSEIERQAREISSQDLNLKMQEAAMKETKSSLEREMDSTNKLSLALSTKDIELGALQMQLESIDADHKSVVDEKDKRLADADRRLREAFDATEELMSQGGHERERLIIRRKDKKITALEKKYQRLSSSYLTLQQRMQAQFMVSSQNAWAECAYRAELEDAQAQLRAAHAYIEQEERSRELERDISAAQVRFADDPMTREDQGVDEESDVSFF
ncbi:Myosin-9 [Pseudocyphellaria aurata]|nr:Myosin-9 [Pseudocyphellaria aurata]